MILKFFKSPTCGPCRMFAPQIESAVKETGITKQVYDVSSDEGFEEAKKYGVTHSGVAILIDENSGNTLFTWQNPTKSDELVKTIKQFL